MLPRTKANARPLNFQATALKTKCLGKYLKNLSKLLVLHLEKLHTATN